MYKRFFKRFFDIFFSLLALIAFALPMLIVAIAIKCTSEGPVIFKTERVGRYNMPFKFYKFRSMRIDAPKDCPPALLNSNEYITRMGRFIRKTSIDELPQLLCVLLGDMSFIGPRPCGFKEDDLVQERNAVGADKVRPGMTGWAQVNGRDVLARDVKKKAKLDGEYTNNIAFAQDVKIFFMTIKKIFFADGVEEGHQEGFTTETSDAEVVQISAESPIIAHVTDYQSDTLQEVAAAVGVEELQSEKNLGIAVGNQEKIAREKVVETIKDNINEIKVNNAIDNIA